MSCSITFEILYLKSLPLNLGLTVSARMASNPHHHHHPSAPTSPTLLGFAESSHQFYSLAAQAACPRPETMGQAESPGQLCGWWNIGLSSVSGDCGRELFPSILFPTEAPLFRMMSALRPGPPCLSLPASVMQSSCSSTVTLVCLSIPIVSAT